MKPTLLSLITIPFLITGILLVCCVPTAASDIATPEIDAPPLDTEHTYYAQILTHVLGPNGVDYAAAQAHKHTLDQYRKQLALATLPTDKADIFALYINAYNALTIALVLELLPEDQAKWSDWSVHDQSGFWKKYNFEVAGQKVSLDTIEHKILRPLGDPRIHFAVNCASKSCPPLAAQPFTAAQLEQQLDAVTTAFANSSYHVRLEKEKVSINKILSWFGGDFKKHGGFKEFLAPYIKDPALHAHFMKENTVRYWSYDWKLNYAPMPKHEKVD